EHSSISRFMISSLESRAKSCSCFPSPKSAAPSLRIESTSGELLQADEESVIRTSTAAVIFLIILFLMFLNAPPPVTDFLQSPSLSQMEYYGCLPLPSPL